MTTHKVSDLQGPMLDGAVAMAEGLTFSNHHHNWCLALDEVEDEMRVYEPSTDWELGGPIIERERIALYPPGEREGDQWSAGFNMQAGDGPGIYLDDEAAGPTALIAAMRAFVRRRFGEAVELP